jgi:hypothetical protein
LSGWNFSLRSFRSFGISINMTVPIVASTERCASGRTVDVQGPPKLKGQPGVASPFRQTLVLTGNNNKISRMTQPIACLYACNTFARVLVLGDQLLKFTLRST